MEYEKELGSYYNVFYVFQARQYYKTYDHPKNNLQYHTDLTIPPLHSFSPFHAAHYSPYMYNNIILTTRILMI